MLWQNVNEDCFLLKREPMHACMYRMYRPMENELSAFADAIWGCPWLMTFMFGTFWQALFKMAVGQKIHMEQEELHHNMYPLNSTKKTWCKSLR